MPSPGALANRRLLSYLVAAVALITIVSWSLSSSANVRGRASSSGSPIAYADEPIHHVSVEKDTLKGEAIMPKLGNETLKAELGRAAWKLFHTTMARFPDEPNEDEKTALFSYIHLFARLYPCGECAGHFRQILNKFPPQVSSRSNAAAWACHVHNQVNTDLKKPLFDCSNIGDFYDCGCAKDADEEATDRKSKKKTSNPHDSSGVDSADDAEASAAATSKVQTKESGKSRTQPELKLEKEDKTRGG